MFQDVSSAGKGGYSVYSRPGLCFLSCNSVGISCYCNFYGCFFPYRFCQNVSDLLFPLEDDMHHLEQPGKDKQGAPQQLTLLTPALYNTIEVSCGDFSW